MSKQHSSKTARLDRVFGTHLVPAGDHLQRLKQSMTPEIRLAIRTMIEQHEKQVEELKDQLEGYDETRDRLRITQSCLIVALQKMGGSLDLYVGQLNEIPVGSVVKVDKLEKGEGDSVPLRISWRPPDPNRPATTDYAPGS